MERRQTNKMYFDSAYPPRELQVKYLGEDNPNNIKTKYQVYADLPICRYACLEFIKDYGKLYL